MSEPNTNIASFPSMALGPHLETSLSPWHLTETKFQAHNYKWDCLVTTSLILKEEKNLFVYIDNYSLVNFEEAIVVYGSKVKD